MSVLFNYYESSFMSHGAMQQIMGTRFDLILIEKERSEAKAIWKEIVIELLRLEKMLNRFDPESEISYVNRHATKHPIVVGDEFWDILNDCKRYKEKTFGLFDITLNDLSSVNLNKDNHSVTFLKPDLYLDLGGYAKGYALNNIKALLLNAEVKHALVDLGNSAIFAVGHHPYGDSWRISIQHPYYKERLLCEIELKDESLATSGNVPSHPKHIIHPGSGQMNEEEKIVYVVSENPIDGEVLSTTFMVAEDSEKEAILSQFEVGRVEQIYYTANDKQT